MTEKNLGRVGTIGRWKPLHNGGAALLESICENAEHVTIGIGSCNKYDIRNPFTANETKDMIDAHLSPRFNNYDIVFINDYGHIPKYKGTKKWEEELKKEFDKYGSIDYFVSGNEYVNDLLKEDYKILKPDQIIPLEKQNDLCATKARYEMAKGDDWKKLLPLSVTKYITKNKLDERFRKEFKSQVLGLPLEIMIPDRSIYAEMRNVVTA